MKRNSALLWVVLAGCSGNEPPPSATTDGGFDAGVADGGSDALDAGDDCPRGSLTAAGSINGDPLLSSHDLYTEPADPGVTDWNLFTIDLGGMLKRGPAPAAEAWTPAELLIRLPGALNGQFVCGEGMVFWDEAQLRGRVSPVRTLPACENGAPLSGSVEACNGPDEPCMGNRSSIVVTLEGYESDATNVDFLFGGSASRVRFSLPGMDGVAAPTTAPDGARGGFAFLDDGTVLCFSVAEYTFTDVAEPAFLRLDDFRTLGKCDGPIVDQDGNVEVCVARTAR